MIFELFAALARIIMWVILFSIISWIMRIVSRSMFGPGRQPKESSPQEDPSMQTPKKTIEYPDVKDATFTDIKKDDPQDSHSR